MAEFNEYILLAIAVAAVMGLLGALSHSDFAKEARSAIGIISLFALIAPIASLLSSGLELPSFDSLNPPSYGNGYIEVTADAYELGLRRAIAQQLDVSEECVSVSFSGFELESMRVKEVLVTLRGEAAMSDARSLDDWIKEEFLLEGGKCEVVITLG